MKKRTLFLSIVTFVCSGVLFIYSNYSEKKLPTICLTDVEALSDSECPLSIDGQECVYLYNHVCSVTIGGLTVGCSNYIRK